MANLSKNTESKYLLDGVQYNAPIDWEDLTIEADYVNDSIQPSLAIEEFTFPLEAREAIKTWFESGLTGGVGCFEGMPFQMTLFNNQPIQQNFRSFIDFTNGYRDLIEDGKVELNIIKEDGVDNFFEQVGSLTYGYLEEIGVITSADYEIVDYVVEKKFNLFEILMTSLVLYLMILESISAVIRTAKNIADVAALTAIPLGGVIAGTILFAATVIIDLAYTVVLLLAVVDLGTTLINTLVPPKREHRVIKLKKALELVAGHLGYTLNAPIDELDFVHYLPSNPRLDDKTFFGFINQTKGTPTGIPNVLDFGYNCAEMFELAKELFNAKIAIVGNTIQLRPKNDPYWIQTSTYSFPDVLLEVKEWNLDELKSERLLSFEVDLNDDWTIDNYLGTSFEIKTFAPTVIRPRAQLLKGLDEVNFKTALGNRKDELNAIERLLLVAAGAIDGVTGILGGGSNFTSQIKSKVGVLKQANNWHTVPKLLYLKGNKLPTNHRDLWKASVLYTKYHREKSFVLDNFNRQRTVYNNVTIPFGFEDFNTLTQNSYFNFNGAIAKITKFTWSFGQDTAVVSFWVQEPYTKNLNEFYIEPS